MKKFLLLLLLIAAQASAERPDCVYHALADLIRVEHSNALELELSLRPSSSSRWTSTMRLITTQDGTLGGLLKEGESFPAEVEKLLVKQIARKNFLNKMLRNGEKYDLKTFPWDALSNGDKYTVLKTISKARKQEWLSDRKFHGMKVRDSLELTLKQETSLFGKRYPKGKNTINLRDGFIEKVEYQGKLDPDDLSMIEIHYRCPTRASDSCNDVWEFLRSSKYLDAYSQQPLHDHLVGEIPLQHFKAAPQTEVVALTDFVMRANLAAEMTDIVHGGSTIRFNRNTATNTVLFGPLLDHRVDVLARNLESLSHGGQPVLGDAVKMGWVGVRLSDAYDGPLKLWGLEYRAIHANGDASVVGPILNSLQLKMHTQEYGIPRPQLTRWLNNAPKRSNDLPTRLSDLWYNKNLDELYKSAPDVVAPRLPQFKTWLGNSAAAYKTKHNRDFMDAHQALKMLLHDWSNSPLVFEHLDLAEKIRKSQGVAIDRLIATQDANVAPVVADFLVDSGLYDAVMKSIGMNK